MRCTVAETYEYYKRAKQLLNSEERDAIIDYLSMHPKEGVLIRGTGGVRKLRWSHDNKGKSGGVRIIYYYHNENIPLYLLSLFSKGEKINLSKHKCNELAKLTKLIKQTSE
ncbi:MAG: type II toxin-antitoxin system RelE/ParE family toxin [Gammaproteobacteria bacterium]|jgi:hypothetical protein